MKNPRCLEAENAKLKAERDAAQKDRDALVEQRQQTELLWQGRLLEATGIATAALAEERIAFLELQNSEMRKLFARWAVSELSDMAFAALMSGVIAGTEKRKCVRCGHDVPCPDHNKGL
jgi:hypothetical protein